MTDKEIVIDLLTRANIPHKVDTAFMTGHCVIKLWNTKYWRSVYLFDASDKLVDMKIVD